VYVLRIRIRRYEYGYGYGDTYRVLAWFSHMFTRIGSMFGSKRGALVMRGSVCPFLRLATWCLLRHVWLGSARTARPPRHGTVGAGEPHRLLQTRRSCTRCHHNSARSQKHLVMCESGVLLTPKTLTWWAVARAALAKRTPLRPNVVPRRPSRPRPLGELARS
jgi:hypothetical protein